jgi:hypothetical protein
MSKIQEALRQLKDLCHERGMGDGFAFCGKSRENPDMADIVAAEAAVLSLFDDLFCDLETTSEIALELLAERDDYKALCKELAEALENELVDPCRLCDYEGMGVICQTKKGCANDLRGAALAHYHEVMG